MKNVCIVGYGAIGPIHAAAVDKTNNASLYAVCDIDSAKTDLCKKNYGIKTYNRYEDVLKDKDIDSVHICTPHYLHFDMICNALSAGKSVVAEKPVTMTKHEFDILKNTANSEKVCLVLQNRYNPCIEMLKKITQSKEYGEIKAIKAIVTWHRDAKYYASGEWRGTWAYEGGGVLINQAVHTLDFMTYLAGSVNALKANMMNYSLSGVIETEDTFTSYMNFKNGASGIFFATNAYAANSAPELEVVFEGKTFGYAGRKLVSEGKTLAEDITPMIGKDYWGTGHEKLIKKYYDDNEYFSLSDAQDTMNTMFAMYKSAKENGAEQII